jgi:hypothetical protein
MIKAGAREDAPVQEIKKGSPDRINRQGTQYSGFFWASGYGSLSIGWSQLEELMRDCQRFRRRDAVGTRRRGRLRYCNPRFLTSKNWHNKFPLLLQQ